MAISPDVVSHEQSYARGEKINKETSRYGVTIDFDPEEIRKKYEAEKAKRDNNGGLGQYLRSKDVNIVHYDEDPYATSHVERQPVDEIYDVVIVGAGYTGLQVAARLIENGITSICIIEKGSGVGGTWYWNRYPGLQCDIESYIYMPLLEEAGSKPSRKYASGFELWQHADRIAEKFGLKDRILFQTIVSKMAWIEEAAHWKFDTNRGDNIRARWAISASGPFHAPKFPGVPGIEKFQGKSFHSCRWEYDYSGGSCENPTLDKLADKTVVIIGTGATAVQLVPQVANWAKKMYVVQRTPSTIDVRGNQPTDMDWFEKQPKGWQWERQDNFNRITTGTPSSVDMVSDSWTSTLREMPELFGGATGDESSEDRALKIQLQDMKKMESLRLRIDNVVKDTKTAEALKPWYNVYCKRPCFHDEYLEAFNKDNVQLIDSAGAGVEAVTERGIIVQGKEYPVDCIIYATGYEWGGNYDAGNSKINIVGRNGQSVVDKFKDGPLFVHGCWIRGFPNLSLLSWTQTGTTANGTTTMIKMTEHMIYLQKEFRKRGIRTVEPSQKMEDVWDKQITEVGASRNEYLKNCVSGYLNNEGDTSDKASRTLHYAGGFYEFFKVLEEWRDDDHLEGLEIIYEK